MAITPSPFPGTYTLRFSYIGYQSVVRKIDLNKNEHINVELEPSRCGTSGGGDHK